jgi:glycosyltransferase involved in cell wall biosynthesis
MKINLIIPSFYPAVIYGGPIFSTLNTCRELSKIKNNQVFVSTTNANMTSHLNLKKNIFLELEKNIFVKYYHDNWINRLSLPLLFNLWKDIKKCDIIHIQAIFSSSTPIALIYSKIFNKPIILSPRGSFAPWILNIGKKKKDFWLKFLIEPFIKNIIWHATAQQEKVEILALFPNAKVSIIPNGINLDEYEHINIFSKKEYLKKFTNEDLEADYVIISMGRLHAKKGFDILIDAFSQLKEKYQNSILMIAGENENELEKLESQCIKLGIKNKVFFIGKVSGQDKIDFLANADLFVLPSHNENFGNVYAESLASGTPIIASTDTPWEEVIKYDCGNWVKNTVEETKNAIEDILEKDLKILGENGKAYVSKFQWKNVALEFTNVFNKLLEHK